MRKINLLDCTLRDGGYINDWNFGYKTICSIINQLVESKVNYVEVGFLRNCEYDPNKTLFNNCEEIKPILPENKGNTMFTAMALHNLYDINKLEPYDGQTIDAIRVTFHDYDIDEGLEFVKKAIDKGYKVFCNPINIMGYSEEQLLYLIERMNEIKPYAFSIVDTFGSMMKDDLVRIYSLFERNLDKSITIGLHLHENLALSYSLAQDFLNICSASRNCVIDGSLLGMGRVPGNLCIELIMDYLNKYYGKSYNVNSALDAIDDYIIPIKQIEPWGYSTAYALSAKYNLHRNYAEYLVGKGKLKAKQINQILANISEEKKTAFDKDYIEQLYLDYQSIYINDSSILDKIRSNVYNRKILILAPGSTLNEYSTEIESFIEENNPVIFSANFDGNNYPVDYMFFSNLKRYEDYVVRNKRGNFLITSNLMHSEFYTDNILNYSDLAFDEKGVYDNCVIMLLRLMVKIGVSEVFIAGFDGYIKGKSNYVKNYMHSKHMKDEDENNQIRYHVEELSKNLSIRFLTPTLYI